MSKFPISDLHCHPTLKPFRGKLSEQSIWQKRSSVIVHGIFKKISLRKWMINIFINNMATYSQCHLNACYKGENRLLFCSVYPFEKPFITVDRPFNNASTRLRRIILRILFKRNRSNRSREIDAGIITMLTGASMNWANEALAGIYNKECRYLDSYVEHQQARDFLFSNDQQYDTSQNTEIPSVVFCMVNSYEELMLKQSLKSICAIYTVEGLHAYCNFKKTDLYQKHSFDELSLEEQIKFRNTIISNLKDEFIVQKKVPFFITVAHHFNNLLVGHSRSFADSKNYKPGFRDGFDQNPGLNHGISSLGKDIIRDYLWSRDFGSRVLVDIKHMSVQSRKDYYVMLREYQNKTNGLDSMPIISSHSAVNGVSTLDMAQQLPENFNGEKNAFVSRYSINLTDEDIYQIYLSDGLIGICMHDGRMPGGRFNDQLKSNSKNKKVLKYLHQQMFLTQLFHIVRILKEKLIHENAYTYTDDLWKILCLGTDYDGIVNPFDEYATAAEYANFEQDLKNYLNEYKAVHLEPYQIVKLSSVDPTKDSFLTYSEILDLCGIQSFESIIERIFRSNTQVFLQKYFTQAYLNDNPEPLIV